VDTCQGVVCPNGGTCAAGQCSGGFGSGGADGGPTLSAPGGSVGGGSPVGITSGAGTDGGVANGAAPGASSGCACTVRGDHGEWTRSDLVGAFFAALGITALLSRRRRSHTRA
jgi:MYXO-CTERM domain-containing protein